jgi:hypothetical protein
MILVAVDIHAVAAAATGSAGAFVTAGTAVIPIALQIDAITVAVCRVLIEAADLTDPNAFGVAAGFVKRAGRTAGSTIVPVAPEIDARTATGLACATCDAARPAVGGIAPHVGA